MIHKIIGKLSILLTLSNLLFANNFILHLKLSKSQVYKTRPIVATLTLKIKNNISVLNQNLNTFRQKNFWVKELNVSKTYKHGGYLCQDYNYLIFAQKSGYITISKQSASIATRQNKTNFIIWHHIYSNTTTLNILPLPKNINIQGNFTLRNSVDKHHIKANKAVNVTIRIKGIGDIDHIPAFRLKIKNAIVYSSNPLIKTYYQNHVYGGIFIQKISIIADKNFIIPSLVLRYFDTKTQTIKTIKTKKIYIKVKTKFHENWYLKYIFGFIGFLIGLLFYFVQNRIKATSGKIKTLYKRVKRAKQERELYVILLPYSQDIYINKILKQLEQNIYFQQKNKINRKKLLNYLNQNYAIQTNQLQ